MKSKDMRQVKVSKPSTGMGKSIVSYQDRKMRDGNTVKGDKAPKKHEVK